MEVVTQELIDEMKAKIALLEGDQKANCEAAVRALGENKTHVAELRLENDKLRNVLCESISADDHIINHVFHNRPTDRACLSNKTGPEAITVMDDRSCDAMKKYNAMRHKTVEKEKRIEALKREFRELYSAIEEGDATASGTNKDGKRLRNLENQLDKAQLKYQEAENIRRTYLQIKEKLKDEQLTYARCLDAMEKQIKTTQLELSDLQTMYIEAVSSRDTALKELKLQEELVTSDRRRREAELTNMKKVAEGKKSSGEKTSPLSVRDSLSSDEAQGGQTGVGGTTASERMQTSGQSGIREDQVQKIAQFEESFRLIKEVTGLSDLDQVVKRFENQGETLKHLTKLKSDAEQKCQSLRADRDELLQQLEELKYSGETELSSMNKLLGSYKSEAEAEAQRREQLHQQESDANRLLVQCKAGVDHIHDKLSYLNVGQIALDKSIEQTEAQLPDMLKDCGERLGELVDSLKDVNVEEQLALMEQEEAACLPTFGDFFSKLEGKIPEYNTRIKLPATQREASQEDDDLAGEENDILTRAVLKKQAEQIVEMRNKKRQPRKKKRRSK